MKVRAIYEELSKVPNLEPHPVVNELFARLVRLALTDKACGHELSGDEVARLQALCGAGEYELERFWAEEILNARDPGTVLRRFPYLQNYVILTELEWSSLAKCKRHPTHSVLFCGGGPLPLTAIVLALNHGVRGMVIDNDREAVELSRRIVKAIGLDSTLTIVHADARTYESYGDHNAIVIAALAGTDDGAKAEILKQVKQKAGRDAHVMARSSWGNRTLLYRPLPKAVCDGLVPVSEVRPRADVVNSIVIFKRRD